MAAAVAAEKILFRAAAAKDYLAVVEIAVGVADTVRAAVTTTTINNEILATYLLVLVR